MFIYRLIFVFIYRTNTSVDNMVTDNRSIENCSFSLFFVKIHKLDSILLLNGNWQWTDIVVNLKCCTQYVIVIVIVLYSMNHNSTTIHAHFMHSHYYTHHQTGKKRCQLMQIVCNSAYSAFHISLMAMQCNAMQTLTMCTCHLEREPLRKWKIKIKKNEIDV